MDASGLIHSSKRIVVKIGSAILTDEKNGEVRTQWLQSLSDDIAGLLSQNKEVIIVSSGAIALGRNALDINYTDSPSIISLEKKQAAAAIGNVKLSQAYMDALGEHNVNTALILLSPKDTEERQSHLNARATLLTLLAHKTVPIINENDTVATSEIRFGDNDRLAARVAQMVEADLLIQLSTIDGAYTSNPSTDETAQHLPVIESLSEDIKSMAGDAPKGLSTGGMKSKFYAAEIAMSAGITMIIASGVVNNPIKAVKSGAKTTLFKASSKAISARKKWISSHVKTYGKIVIDDGAIKALKQGKSLLAAGTQEIIGEFHHGDPVEIMDIGGQKLAVGLVNYSHQESKQLMGHKSGEISDILGYSRGSALIHRDNLVLTF